MTDLIGKTLGRYQIVEQLGKGGMAAVYKAFDARLERHVAVKVILPGRQYSQEFLKRFEREAKTMAQLSHSNIVKVLDYGEQDGIPYLVMSYLPGGTLEGRLGRPMPYREAARMLMPIAQALEYAHQNKMVHRDVKPANILFSSSGQPVLTDFGITKLLEKENTITVLTRPGAGIGTPEYMAPEQWGGTVTPRVDIYALGVVFYELVTGRLPYTADNPASVLIKKVNEPFPRPSSFVPELPGEVEIVIFSALARNPDERYPDMGAFTQALERLAGDTAGTGKAAATQTVPWQEPAAGQQEYLSTQRYSTTGGVPPTVAGYQQSMNSYSPAQVSQPLVKHSPQRQYWWVWGLGLLLVMGLLAAVIIAGLVAINLQGRAQETAQVIVGAGSTVEIQPPVNPTLTTAPLEVVETQAPTQPVVVDIPSEPAPAQEPTETPLPSHTPEPTPTEPPPRPQSATVLWDTSRTPRQGSDGVYDINGVFSSLANVLSDSGITFVSSASPLDSIDLSQYGALVIAATSAYGSAYSDAEAQLIGQFVENGGGLVILAEDSNFTNNIYRVTAYFGVSVAQSTGLNKILPGSDHPIYNGVGAIEFYNGGEVSKDGTRFAITAFEHGAGRVVVVGDSNLFDNRWLPAGDNRVFAANVFQWAAFMVD